MSRATRGILLAHPVNHPGRLPPGANAVAIMCLLAGWLLGCGTRPIEKTVTANSTATKPSGTKVEPADNSYCYVCHVNYQEEPLAHQHEVAGVGCEKCHGLSAKHSADEDNLTAPDHMYSETRVASFCLACHPQEKLASDAHHKPIFAAGAPWQRCTDCHGEHRLKNRTRRWDKDTGKLIWKDSGPVMDRSFGAAVSPSPFSTATPF